ICCEGVPETVTQHPEFVELFGSHAAQALGVYTHHHDHTHTVDGKPVPCEVCGHPEGQAHHHHHHHASPTAPLPFPGDDTTPTPGEQP
ncbi:MAG: metal ABC transporter ATP-binding protein, partial [Magnetococcales bacterium]|nr:metal ABC transporter ATP-binding protein [Magnetococcales bacterium]